MLGGGGASTSETLEYVYQNARYHAPGHRYI
jgi:hypothetical protein